MSKGILADSMRIFKETKKGVEHMCKEMDEIRNEGVLEGRIEGRIEDRIEGKAEAAKNMVKIGMSLEQVAEVLETDKDTIREWIEKL